MARLFRLSDKAWAATKPHLPRGKPGKPRVDDRRAIAGILRILKTGGCWRERAAQYGPPTTIDNRFNRWSRLGVWQRIFEAVAAAGEVPDQLSLDSSQVKAHRSAAGGKGGNGSRRSASRAAGALERSIAWPIISTGRSPSR